MSTTSSTSTRIRRGIAGPAGPVCPARSAWRPPMADRSAPTAQEAFTSLLRAQIAPGLRALGFKGSGQTYELPHLETWALIGFQKSAHNTARHIEFTVNVTV